MSNVTISKELLQALIDIAENNGLDLEHKRLVGQMQAMLDAPEPASVADVTYAVKWQGRHDTGVDAEGIGKAEAADVVQYQNELWFPDINHWAVGTDGTIIGYVGAPK